MTQAGRIKKAMGEFGATAKAKLPGAVFSRRLGRPSNCSGRGYLVHNENRHGPES